MGAMASKFDVYRLLHRWNFYHVPIYCNIQRCHQTKLDVADVQKSIAMKDLLMDLMFTEMTNLRSFMTLTRNVREGLSENSRRRKGGMIMINLQITQSNRCPPNMPNTVFRVSYSSPQSQNMTFDRQGHCKSGFLFVHFAAIYCFQRCRKTEIFPWVLSFFLEFWVFSWVLSILLELWGEIFEC